MIVLDAVFSVLAVGRMTLLHMLVLLCAEDETSGHKVVVDLPLQKLVLAEVDSLSLNAETPVIELGLGQKVSAVAESAGLCVW